MIQLKTFKIRMDTSTKKWAIALSAAVLALAAIIIALFVTLRYTASYGDGIVARYEPFDGDEVYLHDGRVYVDSRLLLTADSGASLSHIRRLVQKHGGNIIGYISVSRDYQILFPSGKTYEELIELAEELEKDRLVKCASPEYVVKLSTDAYAYENDPWTVGGGGDTPGEWSAERPGGSNWGVEALQLPLVWESEGERRQPVRVGLIDTVFDLQNLDLSGAFVKTWGQERIDIIDVWRAAQQAGVSGAAAHGTHTAGIIAADEGNGFGITGAAPDARLYGYALWGAQTRSYVGVMELKYAIALMLKEGVRVIHLGMGDDELLFAAQSSVAAAETSLEDWSLSLEVFLSSCIDAGYDDFLIVKSAGDASGTDWAACRVTNMYPYGWQPADEDDGDAERTDGQARFDILGSIIDRENSTGKGSVKDHLLLVGAAEQIQDGQPACRRAAFSNVGADVFAPGVNILSDWPDGSAHYMSGTSQAAAYVSGVAALVWGTAPELTPLQVKNIILQSAESGAAGTVQSTEEPSDAGEPEESEEEPEETEPVSIVNAFAAVTLAKAAAAG